MIAYLFSKLITMVYGMLYPAYCSYKAVKTKDVKEYVHWMMYWIVFSIFSFCEVFADTFIGCWFPFYYELKIIFMIWMLSPSTRGGSILYRRLIHPSLSRHEPEIDAYLAEFKLRTSSMLVQWGSKAFNYFSEMLMGTLLRAGAGDFRFMNKVSRAYSYEDIDQADMNRNNQDPPGHNINNISLTPEEYAQLLGELRSMDVDKRQMNRGIADTVRYRSVNDNLGNDVDLTNPNFNMHSSGEDSESQLPPKTRTSSRKKKEVNAYETLPRTSRKKKTSKLQ